MIKLKQCVLIMKSQINVTPAMSFKFSLLIINYATCTAPVASRLRTFAIGTQILYLCNDNAHVYIAFCSRESAAILKPQITRKWILLTSWGMAAYRARWENFWHIYGDFTWIQKEWPCIKFDYWNFKVERGRRWVGQGWNQPVSTEKSLFSRWAIGQLTTLITPLTELEFYKSIYNFRHSWRARAEGAMLETDAELFALQQSVLESNPDQETRALQAVHWWVNCCWNQLDSHL